MIHQQNVYTSVSVRYHAGKVFITAWIGRATLTDRQRVALLNKSRFQRWRGPFCRRLLVYYADVVCLRFVRLCWILNIDRLVLLYFWSFFINVKIALYFFFVSRNFIFFSILCYINHFICKTLVLRKYVFVEIWIQILWK